MRKGKRYLKYLEELTKCKQWNKSIRRFIMFMFLSFCIILTGTMNRHKFIPPHEHLCWFIILSSWNYHMIMQMNMIRIKCIWFTAVKSTAMSAYNQCFYYEQIMHRMSIAQIQQWLNLWLIHPTGDQGRQT